MSDFIHKISQWSFNRQRLGKQGTNMSQVLTDIIGVYSAHPSAPLSLHARMKSFSPQEFYDLDSQKLTIRVPAMRLSAYMLPKGIGKTVMRASILPPTDSSWEKRYAQKGRLIPLENYDNWKKEILERLQSPMTVAQLKKVSDIPEDILKTIINRIGFEGKLLRVGASNLRSNIISYISTQSWDKDYIIYEGADNERDSALSWLAGDYLRAFGPARIKDFQWWVGITLTEAKKAFQTIETVSIDKDYLLLKSDVSDFEAQKITFKDSIVLLPQWDTYTMGYAPDGRQRFVKPEHQHHIYGALGATGGNGLGTVLVNGMAHCAWDFRFTGTKMNVSLRIFENTSNKHLEEIKNQINDLASLFEAKKLELDCKMI